MKVIDLRSDTVTRPTPEMYEAIAAAPLGDDVYGDDPTVNKLERLTAKVLGMEAALFVPSGTFGNQLALYTWSERGSEVVLGEDSHIIVHEGGAAAVIAGVQLRPIAFKDGMPCPEAIKSRIRTHYDIHEPSTSLICLENALANGRVVPLQTMQEIAEIAKEKGVPIHLDGARLFNAASHMNVKPNELTAYVDSVMVCLSKGLCAPVGSVLAGAADFINKARYKRKLLGGGMRQAGILAAAGIVALENCAKRLHVDHENAMLLAALLTEINGVYVVREPEINMVFFTVQKDVRLESLLAKQSVLINGADAGVYRMVTHKDVDESDIRKAAASVAKVLS
ncbi:MAG: low-specificity L-threonine aldolase [Defluviitaleaceae bacterium]|nr:low-specificity L-threonine aldolase [Defluviitaleaceae bacterium]